jgi:nicotinamide mononucleotide transporter
LVLLFSAGFGLVLAGTDAEFPYLDSFTTVAAIVATFMVARKVIENWIYWFVIDSLDIYLYLQRDLDWYAGLYLVYLVMIVIGYRAWSKTLQVEAAAADADGRALA